MEKKQKRKINKTEKEINLSRMKIYPACPVGRHYRTGARPACPVAPEDGTGVAPEDGTGV